MCSMTDTLTGERCCLPCPATDWLYPSNFYSLTRIAGIVNVIGLALCVFMLLSFAVLPAEKTRRHYLNVCLVVAVVSLELGFIVPWARRPTQCHNAITPNDMYTSMTCAWSGVRKTTVYSSTESIYMNNANPLLQAFVVFGGVSVNTWSKIKVNAFEISR